MPIVPGLPGANIPGLSPQNQLGQQPAAPSQTNLMMAMAEMHKLGKFPSDQKTAAPRAPRSRQLRQTGNPTLKTLRHLPHNKMGR
jgi:hypothetical protein